MRERSPRCFTAAPSLQVEPGVGQCLVLQVTALLSLRVHCEQARADHGTSITQIQAVDQGKCPLSYWPALAISRIALGSDWLGHEQLIDASSGWHLSEDIEPASIGGPGGEGGRRVVGPSLPQVLQTRNYAALRGRPPMAFV
jgi:hypothetical protein